MVALLLAACESGRAGEPCEVFAAALCDAQAACFGGDADSCVDVMVGRCEEAGGIDADRSDACADRFDDATCDELAAGGPANDCEGAL